MHGRRHSSSKEVVPVCYISRQAPANVSVEEPSPLLGGLLQLLKTVLKDCSREASRACRRCSIRVPSPLGMTDTMYKRFGD